MSLYKSICYETCTGIYRSGYDGNPPLRYSKVIWCNAVVLSRFANPIWINSQCVVTFCTHGWQNSMKLNSINWLHKRRNSDKIKIIRAISRSWYIRENRDEAHKLLKFELKHERLFFNKYRTLFLFVTKILENLRNVSWSSYRFH